MGVDSVGTAAQWIQVVIAGLFYGGVMLFLEVRERKADLRPVVSPSYFEADERRGSPKPILTPSLVVMWLLIGWAFGVFIVFQMFSIQLVMIMLGSLFAGVVLALCIRKWRPSSFIGKHSPK